MAQWFATPIVIPVGFVALVIVVALLRPAFWRLNDGSAPSFDSGDF